MPNPLFYCAGKTKALDYAADQLQKRGFMRTQHITNDTQLLLLDVPSFSPDGSLRDGSNISPILEVLSGDALICGGNLDHPYLLGRKTFDLLKHEPYLTSNALITAHCAIPIAANLLPVTPDYAPTLIIGYGRIGKFLADLLINMGAPVTIALRNSAQTAFLQAKKIATTKIEEVIPSHFRLIINTVPAPVLNRDILSDCENCVLIDLASKRGLDSNQTIWARGLPGIHAPETSGILIAETILQHYKEVIQ